MESLQAQEERLEVLHDDSVKEVYFAACKIEIFLPCCTKAEKSGILNTNMLWTAPIKAAGCFDCGDGGFL